MIAAGPPCAMRLRTTGSGASSRSPEKPAPQPTLTVSCCGTNLLLVLLFCQRRLPPVRAYGKLIYPIDSEIAFMRVGLRQLQIFRSVAETGSFSEAAAKIGRASCRESVGKRVGA